MRVALPGGVATDDQVAPPSSVATANAEASGLCAMAGLAPTATQVVADWHETERSTPVPPATVRGVQVCPPSLDTKIDAPTDTQNVALGQLTEPIAPKPAGSWGTVHVAPPSEETRSWPAYGPSFPGEIPTLTQKDVVGQSAPKSVVFFVGSDDDVHVAPPSFDVADTP